MQMTRKTLQMGIRLSDLDKARLEAHARWFDLSLRQVKSQQYALSIAGTSVREVRLGEGTAHMRLLAELCSRTAQWICYVVGDSCADVYLGHSDFQIRRISELYNQRMELESAGS
jgi:hypothetical protein